MIKGTRVTYNFGVGSATVRSSTRKAMVIGPPIWTEKEKKLKRILAADAEDGYTLYVNKDGDTPSETLKPNSDDYLVEASDLQFHIYDGEEFIDMDMSDSDSDFEAHVDFEVDDYNSETDDTALCTLDYEHFMKLIGEAVDAETIKIEAVTGKTDEFWVSDVSGDYIQENIDEFSVGQTLQLDEYSDLPAWGEIIEIDNANYKLKIKDKGVGVAIETDSSTDDFQFYYDYSGYTVGQERNPSLYFTIRALRPSVSGKHLITDITDLSDLFGNNSIENPDSVLAFDAATFKGISTYEFYIYAFPVDVDVLDESDTIQSIILSTTYHSLAQTRIRGTQAMILVPCHRITTASDVATVKTILSSWDTEAESRSAPGNKNESYVYGALPMINKGYGYTDASAALYGGADLSDSEESFAVELLDLISAYDDYSYAKGIPALFDSKHITITNYYAWMSGEWVSGSTIAAVLAAGRYNYIAETTKNLAQVTTEVAIAVFDNVPTTEYFTDTQLIEITASGWQMIYAKQVGGVVRIGAQHTTAADNVKTKEEHSILATFCLGQDIRTTLEPYLAKGIHNQVGSSEDNPKTVAYKKVLNSAISGLRRIYVTDNGIFDKVVVETITQDENNPNKMIIPINVDYNYPITEHDVRINV